MTTHHIFSYSWLQRDDAQTQTLKAKVKMNEQSSANPQHPQIDLYEIRVIGHLDDRWIERLDCQSATRDDDGTTHLTVQVADQAALYGLIRKLRDLGLPLLSLNRAMP